MGRVRVFVLVFVAIALCGCSSSAPAARQFELEGQILDVRHASHEVLIKHGDIQGFMPGMTMPFKVKDARLLDDKAAGDLVRASLVVAEGDAWIATLEKTGSAAVVEPVSIPASAFVTPAKPGDVAPDASLSDHMGESLTLAGWRGSAIAVTFIYVRCPLAQFCPLLDRRFAQVQASIRSDPRLAGRARLLSISFDPDSDTEARLRAHAARLDVDPAIWRFATAPRAIVDRLAAQYGVSVVREKDGTITHNMRTAVIGTDGRIVSIHESSDWTADRIVTDMRRALAE
jgi:protein SCO1/2